MIRLASIMGVAAVATLVLLSGCETPMKTDYAKDLQGTWMTTTMRDVPNQAVTPPQMVSVTTVVEATISRTDTNMGTVSLAITNTPPVPPATLPSVGVAGKIEVTATEITVTQAEVTPMEAAAGLPGGAEALTQLKLTYDLSDDGSELTVGSELFPALLGAMEIKLDKDTSG